MKSSIRNFLLSCSLLAVVGVVILMCIAPVIIGAIMSYARDVEPDGYTVFINKLLGTRVSTTVNLSPEDAQKYSDLGVDPIKLAFAIAASQWEEKYHKTVLQPGIIYSIDQHEWNGGKNPGTCDAITAAKNNKNLNPVTEENAARELLKIWQQFDVRNKGDLQKAQIYPNYDGYIGHCSAGESGPGFIPSTALRVCKVGLLATGDPDVADCDYRDHQTGDKAVAYEVGRMCPQGANVTCLGGWNQLESWRITLVNTATDVNQKLGVSELPQVQVDSHEDLTDDEFAGILAGFLDDFGLLPTNTYYYRRPPKNADVVWVIYGHMSSISVSPGQHVKKGETIGYCGSTGNSTGSHVHFGTSDLHPDDFTAYHQYNPGWFNPHDVLGTEGWLDLPFDRKNVVQKYAPDSISQDWMEKYTDENGHPAIDFACATGVPLLAVADGIIVPSDNAIWSDAGFGNRVILEVNQTPTANESTSQPRDGKELPLQLFCSEVKSSYGPTLCYERVANLNSINVGSGNQIMALCLSLDECRQAIDYSKNPDSKVKLDYIAYNPEGGHTPQEEMGKMYLEDDTNPICVISKEANANGLKVIVGPVRDAVSKLPAKFLRSCGLQGIAIQEQKPIEDTGTTAQMRYNKVDKDVTRWLSAGDGTFEIYVQIMEARCPDLDKCHNFVQMLTADSRITGLALWPPITEDFVRKMREPLKSSPTPNSGD